MRVCLNDNIQGVNVDKNGTKGERERERKWSMMKMETGNWLRQDHVVA